MTKRLCRASLLAALLAMIAACAANPGKPDSRIVAEGSRARLVLMETTDLHSNIRSYDYYKLAADPSLGLERTTTLIRQARAEFPNTLLFDAGDTIQGTALADYQALVNPPDCKHKLAIYTVMDALGYDGGTIGNHEFNYGLPFLAQVTGQNMNVEGVSAQPCKGPDFPLVLANVFSARDGNPLYAPTGWIDRDLEFVDADGKAGMTRIRIGLIGFAPPPITLWDRRNLEGKVLTRGVVESARQFLPALRSQDVDLVVALSHGGLDASPYSDTMENANWYLSQEPGIDALMLGHSHAVFPDPDNPKSRFADMPRVDNQRGFVNGKPAVMGSFWGKGLGLIELGLVFRAGHWQIDADATHSEVRMIRNADGSFVDPDAEVARLVEDVHQATIDYVGTPIGDSDFAMTTYFTAVGDVSAIQPINMAQRAYVEAYVDSNFPQLSEVPVLSAAAPFKAGFGGATDFTDVAAGTLAIRNAADLYLYPNTLSAVRINGSELKAWLERSARFFNRIDPALATAQELVNRKTPSYNFDVIQGGIRYGIDISKAVGNRVVDLRFAGKPVTPDQEFILATNNYRASGGGNFLAAESSRVLFHSPDMNRDVLINWIRQEKHLHLQDHGSDRPWHFVPMKTSGPVIFRASKDTFDLARSIGLHGISRISTDESGMSTYAIELSSQP